MAKYDVTTIAHWFIKRNLQDEQENLTDKLTLMKLQKLLYYAEGCALAMRGENNGLFDADIVAWGHGPVIEKIYFAYRDDPYNLPLSEEAAQDAQTIDESDQNLLEQVYQIFGQYSAIGLSNKTHLETPWLEATNNGQHLNDTISRKTMREYFLQHYVEE